MLFPRLILASILAASAMPAMAQDAATNVMRDAAPAQSVRPPEPGDPAHAQEQRSRPQGSNRDEASPPVVGLERKPTERSNRMWAPFVRGQF